MPRKKKQRGRPPVKPMPERIDATPEQIAEVVLRFDPKGHEWQYLKETANGDLKDADNGYLKEAAENQDKE